MSLSIGQRALGLLGGAGGKWKNKKDACKGLYQFSLWTEAVPSPLHTLTHQPPMRCRGFKAGSPATSHEHFLTPPGHLTGPAWEGRGADEHRSLEGKLSHSSSLIVRRKASPRFPRTSPLGAHLFTLRPPRLPCHNHHDNG